MVVAASIIVTEPPFAFAIVVLTSTLLVSAMVRKDLLLEALAVAD